MRMLLMFCYISLVYLAVSCGENKTKSTDTIQTKPLLTDSIAREKINSKKTILFFGTSLTAGLGVAMEEAYPALIQQKIDSLKYPFHVINAGLSGETTAAGKNRVEWVLNQPVDIFVLELGANDGLRGIPLSETEKNLQEIIDIVTSKDPNTKIILAGMEIPPNMGPEYTASFREIFPKLASKNKIELIPFLLKDVGGIPKLNQQDGIHPTAEGHQIMAETVWKELAPLLNNNS